MTQAMYTLRYLGEIETTFQEISQTVEPQGTFQVPASEAERYTRRSDIEQVDPAPESKDETPESTDEALTDSVSQDPTPADADVPAADPEPPVTA
jgi:hypothetical protein